MNKKEKDLKVLMNRLQNLALIGGKVSQDTADRIHKLAKNVSNFKKEYNK